MGKAEENLRRHVKKPLTPRPRLSALKTRHRGRGNISGGGVGFASEDAREPTSLFGQPHPTLDSLPASAQPALSVLDLSRASALYNSNNRAARVRRPCSRGLLWPVRILV